MPFAPTRTCAPWRLPLIGSAVALLLSGCALLESLETSPPDAVIETPAPVSEPPASVAPPPTAAIRRPPPLPPPRPAFPVQSLIGLDEEDMVKTLGQPRQVRNDPPAMVWSYQLDGCALNLFFYLDLKTQDFRALAYSFDAGGATDQAQQTCLSRIQEANREHRR